MPQDIELIGGRELGESPHLGLPQRACIAASPVYDPRRTRQERRVRVGSAAMSVQVHQCLRAEARSGDDRLPVDAGKALLEAVRAVRRVQATGVDQPRSRAPLIQALGGSVEVIAERAAGVVDL